MQALVLCPVGRSGEETRPVFRILPHETYSTWSPKGKSELRIRAVAFKSTVLDHNAITAMPKQKLSALQGEPWLIHICPPEKSKVDRREDLRCSIKRRRMPADYPLKAASLRCVLNWDDILLGSRRRKCPCLLSHQTLKSLTLCRLSSSF